jgi:hypothetical protein
VFVQFTLDIQWRIIRYQLTRASDEAWKRRFMLAISLLFEAQVVGGDAPAVSGDIRNPRSFEKLPPIFILKPP